MPNAIVTTALAAAVTVALAAPRPAAADVAAYAEAERLATGDNYRAFAISKLTTWKVGKKCWDKIVDPDGRIMSLTSFMTRDIAAYAALVTKQEWATLEGSGTTEKEANKAKVEQAVAAFKRQFSLSVTVEGDDCDGSHDPLWMQYVARSLEAINATPPASGKAFLSITASAKATKFSIVASKDGATFTIVGPKDTAAAKWQNELGRVFATAGKK
jgi:hypothetical protein